MEEIRRKCWGVLYGSVLFLLHGMWSLLWRTIFVFLSCSNFKLGMGFFSNLSLSLSSLKSEILFTIKG